MGHRIVKAYAFLPVSPVPDQRLANSDSKLEDTTIAGLVADN
jgi:hypothetical protein